MRNRVLTGLMALIFVLMSSLLVTSCAKKQVKVSEGVEAEKAKEAEPSGEMAKAEEEKVKMGDTEAYKGTEAERQAKLRELEEAQKLAESLRAFNTEKIYFDFDKSNLKPPAKEVLKKKADWLQEHPSYIVRIEGHCDERGTSEYNIALGERRAHSAKKFLMALGISEDRILTVSYGEERPADPRHNEEAWAKNRRDEFRAIKR